MVDHVSNYSNLNLSVDYTDAENARTDAFVTGEYMKELARLSFIDSEIAQAP